MEVPLGSALHLLLKGTVVTLELSFLSIFLGLAIGLIVAIMETYGNRVLRWIAIAYETMIRGIPLLVIYFILYFSIPLILRNHFGIKAGMTPFLAAVLGLGIRSSAYQSQIFRSGIQAVEEGQIEAAKSLGMGKWQIIRHVVIPQALKMSLPAWMNEYTIVLKDTSIAFALGVSELLTEAKCLVSITLKPFLYYGMAAAIYLVIVLAVGYFAGYLQKKYGIKGLGVMQHA